MLRHPTGCECVRGATAAGKRRLSARLPEVVVGGVAAALRRGPPADPLVEPLDVVPLLEVRVDPLPPLLVGPERLLDPPAAAGEVQKAVRHARDVPEVPPAERLGVGPPAGGDGDGARGEARGEVAGDDDVAPELLPRAQREEHHPLDQVVEEVIEGEGVKEVQALRIDALAHDHLGDGRAVRAEHRDEKVHHLQADLAQGRAELPPGGGLRPVLPLDAEARGEGRNVRQEHPDHPARLDPALLGALELRIDDGDRHVEDVQQALAVPGGEAVGEELLQVRRRGELLREQARRRARDAREDLRHVRLRGERGGEGRGGA